MTSSQGPFEANIRTRILSNGAVNYDVRFRLNGRYKSRSFPDELSAVKWQNFIRRNGPLKALEALDDGGAVRQFGASSTLAEVADLYLETRTGLQQGTLDGYRDMMTKSINPVLGHIPVGRLELGHISQWVNAMSSHGLAPKTIKNRHGLLSAILSYAADEGMMTKNPAKGMRLPRGVREEMVFLTPAEFAVLMRYIPERHQPLVKLLVGTGMRWGEATALRWRDIDLDSQTVSIVRAWKWSKSDGWEIGPPKTIHGRRSVLMPQQVVQALLPLRGAPDDPVFLSHTGKQLRQSTFYNSVWGPARRLAAGQPAHDPTKTSKVRKYAEFNQPPATTDALTKVPRVHDLRHTHASWLIAAGTPLVVIKDRLGHNSITTTVDRYGHLAPETKEVGRTAAELAMTAAGL